MDQVRREVESDFVHKVFSRIARRYDLMNSVLSFNRHKSWRRFAMEQMDVKPGAECLDVATGTGDWAIALARASGQDGRVVGLDFCQDMLQVAREKLDRSGLSPRVRLLCGDAMAIPFPDDEFDFATIGFGLRNMPDINRVLSEMSRVVKPGGAVVCLELSKPEWKPFRALYYFYFYKILPMVGRLAVREGDPYEWLPRSLVTFPDRRQLARIFSDIGLERVRHFPLTGGICALHIGRKPARVKADP